MRFLKKNKRKFGAVVICMLLFLCLVPLGCGGSSDAETKSPPKTNYELEDMIKEVKDSLKLVQQDIDDLQADIKAIDTKDYDDDIDDLQTQVNLLEALIDELDTPSSPSPNGSQPTATPQTSKLTASISPDDKFLGETGNYSFEITISNHTGKTVNPDVTLTLATNVGTDCTDSEIGGYDIEFYPDINYCKVIFITKESIGNIPSGSSKSIMAEVHLEVAEKVYWTPSVSVE